MQSPTDVLTLDHDRLQHLAKKHASDYRNAKPFEHVIIDNFLPENVAERFHDVFPAPDEKVWLDWTKRNLVTQPGKQGIGDIFPLIHGRPDIAMMLSIFNSAPFISFVEALSGIEGLCPDPYFLGGGLHQILPGGLLRVHSDFNYHNRLKLFRRVNVLIYMNKDWRPEYNGALEMWDQNAKSLQKEVFPIFNRCVIFNTHNNALHGHPKPLATPEGITRKSIALYYYTAAAWPGDEKPRLGRYFSAGDERVFEDEID